MKRDSKLRQCAGHFLIVFRLKKQLGELSDFIFRTTEHGAALHRDDTVAPR
jgi:hypothetical protein